MHCTVYIQSLNLHKRKQKKNKENYMYISYLEVWAYSGLVAPALGDEGRKISRAGIWNLWTSVHPHSL
jgi:hypothetical protein